MRSGGSGTAWIPKYWVIQKRKLSEHTWRIEIKKFQWEEKFHGKPKPDRVNSASIEDDQIPGRKH